MDRLKAIKEWMRIIPILLRYFKIIKVPFTSNFILQDQINPSTLSVNTNRIISKGIKLKCSLIMLTQTMYNLFLQLKSFTTAMGADLYILWMLIKDIGCSRTFSIPLENVDTMGLLIILWDNQAQETRNTILPILYKERS